MTNKFHVGHGFGGFSTECPACANRSRPSFPTRNILASEAPDPLDAAWREAEAVLPEGWGLGLRRNLFGDGYEAEGRVNRIWQLADGPLPCVTAIGPTPSAALRALAVKLREVGR